MLRYAKFSASRSLGSNLLVVKYYLMTVKHNTFEIFQTSNNVPKH